MDIILASTSPYRKRLLERLQLPFDCVAPQVDETALPRETPKALAQRLALAKADAVAHSYPQALVIGSDQTAATAEALLTKPGNFDNAFEQLRQCSGRSITFYTGLAMVCRDRRIQSVEVEPFEVRFRTLSDEEISHYLRAESPYDCAGSFKVEGLGITLFEGLYGRDPTSLEGLPLIRLAATLRRYGFKI
jgi:septum formation protein